MFIDVQIYTIQIEDTTFWGGEDNKTTEAFNKSYRAKNFHKIEWLMQAEYEEGKSYCNLLQVDKFTVGKDKIMELALNNVKVNVKQAITTEVNVAEDIARLANKPLKLETLEGQSNTYNNRVDVHMPGNLMASYNEVMLLEDGCTDQLQDTLDQEWRIIAVCPQPDQRRPDYVLGRYNPILENHHGAKRIGDLKR